MRNCIIVVIGKVAVERVGVELNLSFRVGCLLPGSLRRYLLHPKHLRHEILRHPAGMLRIHRRQRHLPVVSIAAERADGLFLGHDLQHVLQVVDKPVLRGNRPRPAARLVLVVVHQQQAVGVIRHVLQVEIVVSHRRVDIQFQLALLEVLVQRRQQRHVAFLSFGGYLLEVQRDSAIARVRDQELVDLLDKMGARGRIREEVTDRREPHALDRIVVIDQRKDLRRCRVGRRRCDGTRDPVLVVHPVDAVLVHHRKWTIVQGVRGQRAVRRHHVNPRGKEQIDLVDVLFERRVARRIVFNVVRGAQTFSRVQNHIGGFEGRPPMRGGMRLLAAPGRSRFQLHCAAVGRNRRLQQLGQRRHSHQADDEQHPNHYAEQRNDIEDPP